MSKRFGSAALWSGAIGSALLFGCAMQTGTEDDPLAVSEQAIRNGTAITPAQTNTFLPIGLQLSGNRVCSATLLTNNLIATAEHCLPQGGSTTLSSMTLAPTVTGGSTITVTSGTLLPSDTNIPSSFGIDVVLIRSATAFPVDGSSTGFRRKVWYGDPADLEGLNATLVGRGPSEPFEINTFRIAAVELSVETSNGKGHFNRAWIEPPAGAVYQGEGGDSGSGVFVTLNDERFLIGIYTGNSPSQSGSTAAGPNAREVVLLDDVSPRELVDEHLNYAAFDAVGCTGNKRLLLGDFSGDGQTDLLCHSLSDGFRHRKNALNAGGFASSWTSWTSNAWCNHSGARVRVGDFDNDDKDDLLCSDEQGRKWIDLAHNGFGGTEAGMFWDANWCHTFSLFAADIDLDNKADLLCHDPATGRIWIDYMSDNEFAGTDRSYNNGFCSHAGSKLYVGDFDGNGSADILCHDTAGDHYLEFSTSGGRFFTGSNWSFNGTYCAGTADKMYVADLDGDDVDDLICRNTLGESFIDYARDGLVGTEVIDSMRWCTHSGATFHTPKSLDANIARNSAAEFFCHDTAGDVYLDQR